MRKFIWVLLVLLLLVGVAGCGSKDPGKPETHRVTRDTFLVPEASGTKTYETEEVSVDASHLSEGYLMVRYTGNAEKAKVQITAPDSAVYSYTLLGSEYETFPLSGGTGDYHVDVFEHVTEQMYALLLSEDLCAELTDDFLPFLYPNQYVWFEGTSDAARLARDLSGESSDDLDFVGRVYHHVISAISYDEEKAKNISVDYIPKVDAVLAAGKGICFDYASVMAAMLRAQGIPTKLVVGYSGQAYHAWISVYIAEVGWVDKVIQFDGKQWSLMDPTLAANNDARSVRDYVGDGSNYTVKYSY